MSVSGHLTQKLMAVDGSVVKTLKSIAEAAFMTDRNGGSHSGWRLHTHFDIDRHVPSRIEVTPGSNSGHNDEKNRLRKSLLPDHCYVMDRWYAQFILWNDIVAAKSSYVCRIRDNSNLDLVVEERAVSTEAAAAGVLRDIVVDIGATSKPDGPAQSSGAGDPGEMRAAHQARWPQRCARPVPPATACCGSPQTSSTYPRKSLLTFISIRWTIELFFRFFKHVLGCRHLLSTHQKGDRDPGLLCDHRLSIDQPVDGPKADLAKL